MAKGGLQYANEKQRLPDTLHRLQAHRFEQLCAVARGPHLLPLGRC